MSSPRIVWSSVTGGEEDAPEEAVRRPWQSVSQQWPAGKDLSQTWNMERERAGKKTPDGKKRKKKTMKVKKKKPIDNVAVELAAENAKRELVEFLQTKTELGEEEILVAHDNFYEKYPSGEITKREFLIQSKVSQA